MVQQVEHAHQDTRMKDLIHECHEVSHWASAAARHLLEKGEGNEERVAARGCLDAADIADVTARFAARGTPHVKEVAHACGEVLTKCARYCGAIQEGDHQHESLRRTVEACLTAKETCQEVAVNR